EKFNSPVSFSVRTKRSGTKFRDDNGFHVPISELLSPDSRTYSMILMSFWPSMRTGTVSCVRRLPPSDTLHLALPISAASCLIVVSYVIPPVLIHETARPANPGVG